MSAQRHRIDWMPSPPLVPETGSIDRGHLRRMTLDQPSLQREVLGLFLRQVELMMPRLAEADADAAILAHTLKGSARGIGAFAVADAAAVVEAALAATKAAAPGGETAAAGGMAAALAQLAAAVTAAQTDIASLLRDI